MRSVILQGRRARAWFPCLDKPDAACPFDMRVTVAADELVVAPGELTKQTWAGHDRRSFHFSFPHATPACHVALAVGIANAYGHAWKLTAL